MKNRQTNKKQKQKQTNTKQAKTINIIQRIKETTIDGQQTYKQAKKQLTTTLNKNKKQALMCSVPNPCYLDMSFMLCKKIKSFGFMINTISQRYVSWYA
jgi:hypothetical protein